MPFNTTIAGKICKRSKMCVFLCSMRLQTFSFYGYQVVLVAVGYL